MLMIIGLENFLKSHLLEVIIKCTARLRDWIDRQFSILWGLDYIIFDSWKSQNKKTKEDKWEVKVQKSPSTMSVSNIDLMKNLTNIFSHSFFSFQNGDFIKSLKETEWSYLAKISSETLFSLLIILLVIKDGNQSLIPDDICIKWILQNSPLNIQFRYQIQ